MTSPGSMTNIMGYYNLPLVATVANAGYVDVQLRAVYAGYVSGGSSEHSVFFETLTNEWHKDTPGTEAHLLSGTISLPNLVPTTNSLGWNYYWVDIGFEVTFTVKNDGGPVGFSMPDGLTFGPQGTPQAAPEPSTFVLLIVGVVSGLAYAWRRPRFGHKTVAIGA